MSSSSRLFLYPAPDAEPWSPACDCEWGDECGANDLYCNACCTKWDEANERLERPWLFEDEEDDLTLVNDNANDPFEASCREAYRDDWEPDCY